MIVGIIAEFNPLHKGHEALINFVRSQKDFHGCIVVLSSNFTQRGSPAIVDKFTRARMALTAGADVVFELPFLFACSAGQDFSRGGVDLLARTHAATHIAFGMENPEFDFSPLIDAVNSESYSQFLRVELNRGASFSKAHALALEKILPGSFEILSRPNNLLALSYVKEIREKNFALEKIIFPREKNFASKKIRDDPEKNSFMLPEYSREILSRSKISDEKKLWPLLQNIFIRSSPEDLRKIHGVDEGIENLFFKHWLNSSGLDDFIGRCVCARYTRSHIRRRLVYILLGLDRWKVRGAIRGGVPYARVLGFSERGREILRECSRKSEVKIITRLKDAESTRGKFFASVELKASQLYELASGETDETQKPLVF